MTTYHVWLVDQLEPEIVRAGGVYEYQGELSFYDMALPDGTLIPMTLRRTFVPKEWRQWAVVHDEADTVHL